MSNVTHNKYLEINKKRRKGSYCFKMNYEWQPLCVCVFVCVLVCVCVCVYIYECVYECWRMQFVDIMSRRASFCFLTVVCGEGGGMLYVYL